MISGSASKAALRKENKLHHVKDQLPNSNGSLVEDKYALLEVSNSATGNFYLPHIKSKSMMLLAAPTEKASTRESFEMAPRGGRKRKWKRSHLVEVNDAAGTSYNKRQLSNPVLAAENKAEQHARYEQLAQQLRFMVLWPK